MAIDGMSTLHHEANRLLDCWMDEDQKRYADTRREIHEERGAAFANTVHQMAKWQIEQYRGTGQLPEWRREWIERAIGEDPDGRAEQED